MNKIKRGSKEHILRTLNKAKQAILDEQDEYRVIIENSFGPEVKKEIDEQYIKGGWEMVLKAMADCKYPPIPSDREHFLRVDWDEELSYLRLQKIKDKQVRAFTHHLNRLIEHTQRLRSMTLFVERVGTLQGRGGKLFSIWSQNSGLQIMLKEALTMGKDERTKVIRQCCKANDCFAQLVLELDWDPETIGKATLAAIKEQEQRQIYGCNCGTASPGKC